MKTSTPQFIQTTILSELKNKQIGFFSNPRIIKAVFDLLSPGLNNIGLNSSCIYNDRNAINNSFFRCLMGLLFLFSTQTNSNAQSAKLPNDSLNGFDKVAELNKIVLQGYATTEHEGLMRKAEVEFLENKYNLNYIINTSFKKGGGLQLTSSLCNNSDFEMGDLNCLFSCASISIRY